jgi:hypothetical protein
MSDTTFSYNGTAIQTFTVQTTGTYEIIAFGGQGGQGGSNTVGGTGGLGAEIGGEFSLTQGEVLQIVVGASAAAAEMAAPVVVVAASSSRLSMAPVRLIFRW